MTLTYYLLSCFHGIQECFIPFSPRKSIAWLSTILLIIVSASFGASVFLVAFDIIPTLSIASLIVTIIGLVTSVLGIVAAALDHPEIYLAFAILSGIITSFNLLVLCYFVYTAIKESMDELHLPQSERFWTDVSKFNVSIGLCALAFAAEMTLFLTSAYLAIRARMNSLVRLENEEIDALLQDTISVNSATHNRSFAEQVAEQSRILQQSQNSGRFQSSARNSQCSLTQSQRDNCDDDNLPL